MVNRQEFKNIVMMLKGAYKNFIIENETQFSLWYGLLSDVSYEALNLAVSKHIAESEFPPTIASLRKAVSVISNPEVAALNNADAWEEVKEAIRKFGYYRESEALESMTPITAHVVRAMSWRDLCLSENQMADRAHFIKMFDTFKEREQKQALLPEGIKQQLGTSKLVKQLSDKLKL